MIYVTSDLHGCDPAVLKGLLKQANFSDRDFLYVLGDVADRGESGAELYLWLTQMPNAELILGNHEGLLLACGFLFAEVSDDSLAALTMENMALMENWLQNGGGPTIKGFRKLLKQDPELVEGILDYLGDCPLYKCVQVRGKKYLLVHAGLENFRRGRPLEDYTPEELLMARPGPDTVYDLGPEWTVVFGHTPTELLNPKSRDRALRGRGWICIDTGAARGGSPMLLRLEDGKEFYYEEQQ